MRSLRVGLAALLLASCSAGEPEVVVSAASSLQAAFEEISFAFEHAHPDVGVVLNFGSSARLRTQILEGAPVDVYAAADSANMERVAAAGFVAVGPAVFARNRMTLGVPVGNPAGVRGVADLARDDLLVGLCAAAVPCGTLADRVLAAAGVQAAVDTREPDARALVTKIDAGELDVGLVYATDISGGVEGVAVDSDVAADYPVAVISSGEHRTTAESFVEFLLSAEARSVLVAHGFSVP